MRNSIKFNNSEIIEFNILFTIKKKKKKYVYIIIILLILFTY